MEIYRSWYTLVSSKIGNGTLDVPMVSLSSVSNKDGVGSLAHTDIEGKFLSSIGCLFAFCDDRDPFTLLLFFKTPLLRLSWLLLSKTRVVFRNEVVAVVLTLASFRVVLC